MKSKLLSERARYFQGNRFALAKFLTRFGAVEYHVSDADTVSSVADIQAGKVAKIVYRGNYKGALAFMRAHRTA